EVGLEPDRAAHRGLLGLHRQAQEVLEAPICAHVERDRSPLRARRAGNRSLREDVRAAERGVHLLEVGVAVRAIDDGDESGVEIEGLMREIELKIWRRCRALD